jgi:hypothetical protein
MANPALGIPVIGKPYTITLMRARQVLSIVWFTGVFAIICFFATQTMFGVFGDDNARAWGWLTPHIAPSVSLILSGYVATAFQDESERTLLSKPWIFWVALLWSGGYLVLLFSVIFFERVFPQNLFTVYESSNVFLGIVQGVVSAFLAVFFMAGQKSLDNSSANKMPAEDHDVDHNNDRVPPSYTTLA